MADERYILIRPPQLPELTEVGAGAYVVGYDSATDRTVKINVSALGGAEQVPDLIWRSNVEYELNEIKEYGLKLWKSKIAGNQGNIPSENQYWTEVSKAGEGGGITNYVPGVYTYNPAIVLRFEKLYRLAATLPFESTDFDAELELGRWRLLNDSKIIGVAYGVGMTGNYTFVNLDDTLIVLNSGSVNSVKEGTNPLTISLSEPSYIVKTGAGNTLSDFTILPIFGGGGSNSSNLVYIIDAETVGNDLRLHIPLNGVVLFMFSFGDFTWVDEQDNTIALVEVTAPSMISRTGVGETLSDLDIVALSDLLGGKEYVQPISFAITDKFTYKPSYALSITSADVSSNITDLRVGKNGATPATMTFPYTIAAADILTFEVSFTDTYDRELNSFITLIGQYL